MSQRYGIELKLEDLTARTAPGMQPAQTKRLRESDPACVNSDGHGHAVNALSSSATQPRQSGWQVPQSWGSHSF